MCQRTNHYIADRSRAVTNKPSDFILVYGIYVRNYVFVKGRNQGGGYKLRRGLWENWRNQCYVYFCCPSHLICISTFRVCAMHLTVLHGCNFVSHNQEKIACVLRKGRLFFTQRKGGEDLRLLIMKGGWLPYIS